MFRRKRATDAGAGAAGPGAAGSDSASAKESSRPYTQRKPANTAWRQQRLKAWQPVLTPRTVLPTFFLVGLLFAPIGAVLYYYATKVSEFTIDYTDCRNAGSEYVAVPSGKYDYQLPGSTPSNFQAPQWRWVASNTAPNGFVCDVQFSVPQNLEPSVFLYYKLTNYYQNHRRYVKSIDTDQLLGKERTVKDLGDGQCKPLGREGDRGIWPCGLIANSMFNDTYSLPVLVDGGASNQTYQMTDKGIVWPGEKNKYAATPTPPDQLVPPPFWRGSFTNAPGAYNYPNGYTADNIFNPSEDEHFMVWMRTAGLPTFRKLYYRNDNDVMLAGRYIITITDNYPVAMFSGTKSIVFSTATWVGGRSLFLGSAYIAVAALCVLLGLIFTARHLIRPRKLGDLSLLSWNE
ncbi:Lem3/Cdc50 [Tilletiopsis washingtonensis]|uniref:Lem3/Cdc50 n=1 Tax=Tilletiopsis washingtonensis TaxID=58919 RepID=A0A316Z4X0_9BASI|nr:Lem3/Cdc50 [Tilletiopsis washingtonensis]PWN96406.1 Lem3/Cdc50 [Tilletiopsis washingtonensis]